MSETKRNGKKLTTSLDSTSKLLPETVFPFLITLIANEIQKRLKNYQFSKTPRIFETKEVCTAHSSPVTSARKMRSEHICCFFSIYYRFLCTP